jgi:hypothetical protein
MFGYPLQLVNSVGVSLQIGLMPRLIAINFLSYKEQALYRQALTP